VHAEHLSAGAGSELAGSAKASTPRSLGYSYTRRSGETDEEPMLPASRKLFSLFSLTLGLLIVLLSPRFSLTANKGWYA